MRKIYVIVLLTSLFVIADSAYTQLKLNVKVSASNLFRYGNGKEITVTSKNNKEYFEELGDVRLFVNDFLFGIRYEYDDPIEFGTGTKGISRRFVEFRKDDFTVRAGNFYDIFEKGLTLYAFENRGLGYNTQLDGIKVNYKFSWKNLKLNATLLGGGLNYDDYLNPGRVEKYSIRAGNLNFSPFKFITIGGSYLYTKGDVPSGANVFNIKAEIYEANLGLQYKFLSLFASYANKQTITAINPENPRWIAPKGDGGYGSISFAKEGLGATLEYKNYRFNVVTPDEAQNNTSPVKALPFQIPPSCIREHTSTLLSRYPHQVNFNDEVGFQLDAFYSPIEDLTFNLNASLSSKHYDYVDVDTTVKTRYQRVERNTDFLPSPKDPFSPYWEVYLEAEYYFKKNMKFKAAVARQSSVLYSTINPGSSDKVRTFTIPVEVKYDFMKIYSVKLSAEQQWVFNSARTYTPEEDSRKFFNEYLSLSISRSPNLIINWSVELSNDKEDASRDNPEGRIVMWAIGEITYKFTPANSVTLSYGSERGGLKCTSGICRYVNPFEGFRLTVINNFN